MLLSLLTFAVAAANSPPSFSEQGAFICTPVHLAGPTGPLKCAEGATVTLWGVAATPSSGCRAGNCVPPREATRQLVERLRAHATPGPHGDLGLSGATPINCLRVERAPVPTAALCSAPRLDGVIVGGGEDLGCWLLERRLVTADASGRRFYARCTSRSQEPN